MFYDILSFVDKLLILRTISIREPTRILTLRGIFSCICKALEDERARLKSGANNDLVFRSITELYGKIISLKECAPGSKLSMQGAPASTLGLHSESFELQNLSKKKSYSFMLFFFSDLTRSYALL